VAEEEAVRHARLYQLACELLMARSGYQLSASPAHCYKSVPEGEKPWNQQAEDGIFDS
jgi:hypothetical protein